MKIFNLLTIVALFVITATSLQSCLQEAQAKSSPTTMTTDEGLIWHSVNDLVSLQKKNPKNVIVDVYTDWCKWCKVMDTKTFSDPNLAKYLNEHYYMVKLNAETKDDILFKGKNYKYITSGRKGYNQLAAELCKGSLSYPSFVILDKNLEVVEITRGYKNSDQFRTIIDQVQNQI